MLTNFVSIFINRARPLLRKIFAIYRGFRPDIAYSAKMAQRSHKWETALSAWKKVIDRFPKNMNAHLQCGEVLINMGRFKEAEAIFQKTAKKWPESPSPLAALARIFQKKRDYEQACRLWQTVSDAFPKNLQYRAAYIQNLLNILEFDKALYVYTDTAKKTRDPVFLSVLADIHAAEYNWPDALDVLQSIRKSSPYNIRICLKETYFTLKRALNSNTPDYFNQAIELLERFDQTFTWNLTHQLQLATAYVYVHRNEDANRVIEKIPDSFNTHKKVMELRSWQQHHYDDEKRAKHIWDQLLQRHYIPIVHSQIDSLKRIENNALNVKPGEILLFSAMYNELWRIPWFLDYYRDLGVDHFFIIDNASDDGTSAFLLEQKDVHTFLTNDNYAKASSGMRWINELFEKYGQNNWCLYADIDEALVFPGVEKFGLNHLTEYMEKNGHEVLSAFMLDMHSHDNRQQQADCLSVKDFTVHYPYFDNNYNTHGNIHCPYKRVTGGIRSRIFKISDIQTKTPLIRGGKNIRFLSSSHTTTPAIISDVTAVLLHYKMVGDFHDNSLKTISHGTRISGTQQRYLSYTKTLQNLGEDHIFVNGFTKRYENSDQLVKLGFMNCPETFFESI